MKIKNFKKEGNVNNQMLFLVPVLSILGLSVFLFILVKGGNKDQKMIILSSVALAFALGAAFIWQRPKEVETIGGVLGLLIQMAIVASLGFLWGGKKIGDDL